MKSGKPGFTKSDNPKSMAFSREFSSLDVNKKFWSSNKLQLDKNVPWKRKREKKKENNIH